MPDYQFPAEIRPHVEGLANLMQYANARDDGRWACMASRRGVYGFAYSCLQAIITELHGDRIAQAAMDCINYGGNFSWLEDVEIAVSEALEAYPV